MSDRIKVNVHRGRTKEGKVVIQIALTVKEIEELDRMASELCRSRTSQALWLVKEGMEGARNE
jgi:hypothetical protein